MEIPEIRYAKTVDGFHIAYQTLGAGPTELVPLAPYFSNLEHLWAEPDVASFRLSFAELGGLIMFDARGTGLSDRVDGDRLPTLYNGHERGRSVRMRAARRRFSRQGSEMGWMDRTTAGFRVLVCAAVSAGRSRRANR